MTGCSQGQSQAIGILCVIFVLVYVIMFATGPGSIPWFLVSELFNQAARPTASALAVCINWTANFLVGLAFLPLAVSRLKPVSRPNSINCTHLILFYSKSWGHMYSSFSSYSNAYSCCLSTRKYQKRKINHSKRYLQCSGSSPINKTGN